MLAVTPFTIGSCSISFAWSSVSGRFRIQGQLSAEPLHDVNSAGQRDTKKVVGPAAARLRDTPELIPCTAADITVTTSTPTAIPRIVNAARTLFVRMESKAMNTPSAS